MSSDDPDNIKAYQSHANPRKREDEGALVDDAQAQNGSGFKDEGLRPEQNCDWYGVRRPDPSAAGADKADPAHLQAAAVPQKSGD